MLQTTGGKTKGQVTSEFQRRFFLTTPVFSISTLNSTSPLPFFCEAKTKWYENTSLPTLDNLLQRVLFYLQWWAEYHGTAILLQNRTYALGDLSLDFWVCTPSYYPPWPCAGFFKVLTHHKLQPQTSSLVSDTGEMKMNCIWEKTSKDNQIKYGNVHSHKRQVPLEVQSSKKKPRPYWGCLQEELLCVLWTYFCLLGIKQERCCLMTTTPPLVSLLGFLLQGLISHSPSCNYEVEYSYLKQTKKFVHPCWTTSYFCTSKISLKHHDGYEF